MKSCAETRRRGQSQSQGARKEATQGLLCAGCTTGMDVYGRRENEGPEGQVTCQGHTCQGYMDKGVRSGFKRLLAALPHARAAGAERWRHTFLHLVFLVPPPPPRSL